MKGAGITFSAALIYGGAAVIKRGVTLGSGGQGLVFQQHNVWGAAVIKQGATLGVGGQG